MQYPLETLIYIGTGIAGKTPSYWAWLELFNWYFMSLFTSDPITCNSADEEYAGPNVDPTSSDLTFTVTQVLNVLANFDASKAMGPDEIPARILKEIAYEIASFLCKLFNTSLPFPWTGNWPTWSLYSRRIIKNKPRTTGQSHYCAWFPR